MDGRIVEWGGTYISGSTLKSLAGVEPMTHDVWLEVPHGEDRLIDDAELFDLSAPGVEKFITGIKTITIIVNGRPRQVHKVELSFLEVVRLAFPDAVINETTAYTVTFKRGPADRPEGSLVEGESVRLKNGMVFNVTATDKS
ncbi:multiubiquitin domain-containing protein [Methylococcus mesophilus]|uniref:multiubiquitin domain-containing protein n=1 Tax=Methylococcus mesophilus TaxID=2993564 RepID=UPI00224BA0E4|nr:multiubiquitin domain-containing protein [Methylococcus mesophilus]UZR31029.1 multiubiquitin domain-containing protein [Methylococcus mesophilus]